MSQIIKAFMGTFLILFMAATCLGLFSTFLTVLGAQDMHAAFVNEIEESGFYPDVIADCFDRAKNSGYALTVTLLQKGGRTTTIKEKGQIPSDAQSFDQAKVELDFSLQVPILGIENEHSLMAYAQ